MKKIIVPILCIVGVIYGIVKINIINTEALSPLGNTENNFKLVSQEFGEDFAEFIKDKSPMKIYLGEEGEDDTRVKINDFEIRLTKNNLFLKGVQPVFNFIEDKISDFSNKKSEKTNNNEEKDLDSIIEKLKESNNN